MKKTYQMFLALMAMTLFGAVNAGAQERIPFDAEHFTFHSYDGWDADAVETGVFNGAFLLGQADGCPIGDTSCNAWVDLTGYSKLYVEMVGCDGDGIENGSNPRIFINRTVTEGQFSSDRNASNCLVIPNSGTWATDYYTVEGNTYVIDLKKIATDWGFVHFHSIKGSAWNTKVIVNSIEVEKTKKPVGWINILTNGDLEGDDISSFRYSLHADNNDGDVTYDAEIEDGVGVDGSRGLSIKSDANAPQSWSTQLFVVLPELLPAGTLWRFSMDACSNPDAEISTAYHAEPRQWKGAGSTLSSDFSSNLSLTSDWSTITASGTISEDLAENFKSLCFDLNLDQETATQYYFDNVKFEIYKYGTIAEFNGECVKVDFGFDTNIAELCKAAGKRRVLFPVENAKVLANGEEVEILSVEGFADGRFYIFLGEALDDDAEVHVSFKNTADDLQLVYAGGPNAGQVIPNVDETADYNDELDDVDDVYSYFMLSPSVVSAYPEQGSFNVKKDLKEFNVKFDKLADASQIVATLDGNALTVSPNDGLAEEFVLTYAGDDLADGLHTINITKIYPEVLLAEEVYADTTYQFSVGAPDPNDQNIELIPISYFNTCANNGIPEGFKLYADGMEERTPGNTYSSGSRLFNDFKAGGDFTSALYIRRNYATYGFNDDEHKLTMEAGKPYTLSFNTARWKASGEFLKVLILDAAGQEKFNQTVTCNPNVDGSKESVKNSSAYTLKFTPDTEGDYELRFVVATDAEGTDAGDEGMHEVLLANVKFGYISSSFGVAETMALTEALEKAEKTLADNNGDRYNGSAKTALIDAIGKVTDEKDNYTSPSECNAATELLNNCSAALIDHVALCDNYDKLIKEGSDVVRQHANDKFAALELYLQLVDLANKYHAVSVMQNDGTDEEPNWQKHYTFDELIEDAQLTAAIAELNDIVNTTAKLFTTGPSRFVLGNTTTGVAALVERLRLGAETLKALGMTEDSYPLAQALNALDDDDELAEEVKKAVKVELYGHLKNNENIFETVDNSDPDNPETKAVTYDMSVFVKNPNLYAREYTQVVTGWEKLSGNAQAWTSWNGNESHNSKTAYVEDCKLHPGWHANATVEQTIIDLPAGVYTIQFKGDDNDNVVGTYGYVKTSATPAVEDGAEIDMDLNYAGYSYIDGSEMNAIENITVTDGQLILGFVWGPECQAFMDEVHILMTAPAKDFDYVEAYNNAVTDGIETVKTADKASNGVIYNLAGQKVNNSFKGIVIKNGKKFVVK